MKRLPISGVLLMTLVVGACGGRSAPVTEAASPEPAPTAQPSVLPASPSPSFAPSPTVRPSPSATSRAGKEVVFVEYATGRRLSLQADPAARDLGRFAFGVPDLGAYSGSADKGIQVSPTAIVIDYAGAATFIPLATASSSASPAPRGPTTVTIRLQARLDPVAHTGTATLTHGSAVLSLTAAVPGTSDLDPVVLTFERATVMGDADAIYSVMNSDLTAAYTAVTFAQQWSAERARVGTIGALRRLSLGPPLFGDFGFWLVVAQYEAEKVTPAGAQSVVKYDVYFVRERGGWKVLASTER